MGAVDTTYTFTATDTITSSKMNNIIDQTTITTDAIIGTTLDVASGKLKIRSAGITSNEMGEASVTQSALASNVATTGPAFHVNMGGTSQSIPNTDTVQVIQFDNELFNVGSCFNTSNYRFTPNVSGYYQINLSAAFNHNNSGNLGLPRTGIRKNGNILYDVGLIFTGSGIQLSDLQMSGSILLYMNGSTDYIEGTGLLAFGTTTNALIVGGNDRTFMSGFLARSA